MARRVQYYKVTHKPSFNSFLISFKHGLFEEKLKFVYEQNGKIIEKLVPLTYIGPLLNEVPKKMIYYDIDMLEAMRRDKYLYSIDEKYIFNY